jgi:hypothetical protein
MCPLPQGPGSHGRATRAAQGSRGAYGLRLAGIAGCDPLLVAAEETWPLIRIVVRVSPVAAARAERLDGRSALVGLRTGGWIEIDRSTGLAAYSVPSPLSDDEIVHPFLAPVAAVVSHWCERESIHGGAFALAGTAWGVVGDRMGGKSSLLAALAARGIDVLADDLVVLDQLTAFAGPRTVDLREDAAAALGLGESIGRAGARERWRLRLGPAPGSASIAGWIFVGWGDRVETRRLRGAEALERLLGSRGIRVSPTEPERFLQLAALPAWELRRPRSWSSLPESVERLLSTVAG